MNSVWESNIPGETSCIKGEPTGAAVRGADHTKSASRKTFHLLAKMLAQLSPGEGFHWLAWEACYSLNQMWPEREML